MSEDSNERTTIFEAVRASYKPKAHETAYVEPIQGEHVGRMFGIDRDRPFVVGRAAECEICLQDAKVSRRHTEIAHHEGEYRLHDLGSTNGTFVGQVRVAECTLHDGDIIQIGQTVLRFRVLRTITSTK
ncbi:MAG: FHA domain-containing protein [Nitrospirae bacterium]|nr:FHA domain-containing protein [Nitrospirota bacterium]